jgi:tRNA (guanine37-N1)-methyltransferase
MAADLGTSEHEIQHHYHFPGIFDAYLNEGVLKRALQNRLIEVEVHNLRDYTLDKHRSVDDYPYGGGSGMVMKPDPFFSAVETLHPDAAGRRVIMLSPAGKKFDQQMAVELSKKREPCFSLWKIRGDR